MNHINFLKVQNFSRNIRSDCNNIYIMTFLCVLPSRPNASLHGSNNARRALCVIASRQIVWWYPQRAGRCKLTHTKESLLGDRSAFWGFRWGVLTSNLQCYVRNVLTQWFLYRQKPHPTGIRRAHKLCVLVTIMVAHAQRTEIWSYTSFDRLLHPHYTIL